MGLLNVNQSRGAFDPEVPNIRCGNLKCLTLLGSRSCAMRYEDLGQLGQDEPASG